MDDLRRAVRNLAAEVIRLRRDHETLLRRLDAERSARAAVEAERDAAVRDRDRARCCAAGLMEAQA